MPRRVTIRRPERPIDVSITLPRSKSVANRALVMASLAGDLTCVKAIGDADDTRLLRDHLRHRPRVMHCGLGGTTFRFLLAWASVQENEEHIITGEPRLLERPHVPLIDALRSLGADITQLDSGFRVRGRRLAGGEVLFDSPISSQFISALLLIAPFMRNGLLLKWTGQRLSEPYVRMTMKVLSHFNAVVEEEEAGIRVPPAALQARPLEVPRDWSAAAFWFEIAALADEARIVFEDLRPDGWQGDEAIMRYMAPFVLTDGRRDGTAILKKRIEADPNSLWFDLSSTPDLFQPLALTCAALGLRTTITGLRNLSVKEADRVAAVVHALDQCGLPSLATNEGWQFSGGPDRGAIPPGTLFDPQGDHRMAMSVAPLALVCGSITIIDPMVVTKSYPAFWDDLARAGFRLEWG